MDYDGHLIESRNEGILVYLACTCGEWQQRVLAAAGECGILAAIRVHRQEVRSQLKTQKGTRA